MVKGDRVPDRVSLLSAGHHKHTADRMKSLKKSEESIVVFAESILLGGFPLWNYSVSSGRRFTSLDDIHTQYSNWGSRIKVLFLFFIFHFSFFIFHFSFFIFHFSFFI